MLALAAATHLCAKEAWRIVVAHYREQLDWLPSLLEADGRLHPGGRRPSVYVYHKGGDHAPTRGRGVSSGISTYVSETNAEYFRRFNGTLKWITLENIGREVETFTRHLFSHYDDLAPMTAFLQGNPEHSDRRYNGTVLRELKQAILYTHGRTRQAEAGGADSWLEGRRVQRFGETPRCQLLGAPMVPTDGDGCPNHCGIAIMSTCSKLATRLPVKERLSCHEPFPFVAGGMFCLSRAAVHAYKRPFYLAMQDMLYAERCFKKRAPLYPYVYERLWGRLFNCSWSRW